MRRWLRSLNALFAAPGGTSYETRCAAHRAIRELNHALVLNVKAKTLITSGAKFEEPTQQKYFGANWIWVVEKVDEKTTRLIDRWSMDYSPGLGNQLTYGTCFVEPISFVMDRKMLLGIKQRAEAGKEV